MKSLVAFPQILEPMYDKLGWPQKLGDAVLDVVLGRFGRKKGQYLALGRS